MSEDFSGCHICTSQGCWPPNNEQNSPALNIFNNNFPSWNLPLAQYATQWQHRHKLGVPGDTLWISEAKDFRLLKFKINLAFVYFLKKRHINFYLSCSLRISLLRPPVVPGEHQACPASGHWRFWFPLPWTLFPPHLPNGGPFPFLCKASDGASLGKPLCPTLPTSILRTALAETLQNSVYLFTASLTH